MSLCIFFDFFFDKFILLHCIFTKKIGLNLVGTFIQSIWVRITMNLFSTQNIENTKTYAAITRKWFDGQPHTFTAGEIEFLFSPEYERATERFNPKS